MVFLWFSICSAAMALALPPEERLLAVLATGLALSRDLTKAVDGVVEKRKGNWLVTSG